jgi:hypothetical protein
MDGFINPFVYFHCIGTHWSNTNIYQKQKIMAIDSKEIEKLAYEQIGRLVVAELNTNKPFAKEFNRRAIGDKVNQVAKNYLIDAYMQEKKEAKKSFWKRLFSWLSKDHNLHQKHAL